MRSLGRKKVKVKVLNYVQLLRPHGLWPARLLCPWGFSRQEYWSGLPFPSPGNLPNPGIEPRHLFTIGATGESHWVEGAGG